MENKKKAKFQKSEEICEIDIGRKLRGNIEAIFTTRNGEIFESPRASAEDSAIQRYSSEILFPLCAHWRKED